MFDLALLPPVSNRSCLRALPSAAQQWTRACPPQERPPWAWPFPSPRPWALDLVSGRWRSTWFLQLLSS